MKLLLLSFLVLIGCTDTELAHFSALGEEAEIECFSGGISFYKGKSTGKIMTTKNSDGWEFKEFSSGKLIRVSGSCIIKN